MAGKKETDVARVELAAATQPITELLRLPGGTVDIASIETRSTPGFPGTATPGSGTPTSGATTQPATTGQGSPGAVPTSRGAAAGRGAAPRAK